MQIIDVHDLKNPILNNTVEFPGNQVTDVILSNDEKYAYVACMNSSKKIGSF